MTAGGPRNESSLIQKQNKALAASQRSIKTDTDADDINDKKY
jgi:hypothetical protein